jgi:hypothetical protein
VESGARTQKKSSKKEKVSIMAEERRHDCRFEDRIIGMALDMESTKVVVQSVDKRINGVFQRIGEHINEGIGWRRVIVGVVLTMLIQLGTFIWFLATLNETVKYNTKAINKYIPGMKE